MLMIKLHLSEFHFYRHFSINTSYFYSLNARFSVRFVVIIIFHEAHILAIDREYFSKEVGL